MPDTLPPVAQPGTSPRYQASARTLNGARTPVLPHCHSRADAAIPSRPAGPDAAHYQDTVAEFAYLAATLDPTIVIPGLAL